MTRGTDRLERLFSRRIDGECTLQEERQLQSLLERDPQARRMYEDYRRLDERFGEALRAGFAQARAGSPMRAFWARLGRGALVAAAACVAMLVWLQPTSPSGPASPNQPALGTLTPRLSGSPWFKEPRVDVAEPTPTAYERPELRVGGTQREWILIPTDEPKKFMVIEVNRVRTHVIVVHRDF